jgi:hypothetical protein
MSKRVGLAGNAARMGEENNACRVLMGIPEMKWHFGRL